MLETSFGHLVKLDISQVSEVNFLSFSKRGRAHKHPQKEVVYITSGSGAIHIEGEITKVSKGDLITIDRLKSHYMVPTENEVLELMLFYS
ncbi:cupin domain-containing protein [Halobacteriovorax sp. XZX-3]|uniref:cupin domain-containing protein n=1 Tax=unclassified Halobacteriovorax TaxID=2639665 RepID=UPI00371B25DA